jgi:tetratricopeptide (TPR) repeat protein
MQLAAEFPSDSVYKQEAQRIHEHRIKSFLPKSVAEEAADDGQHQEAAKAFRDVVRLTEIMGTEFNGNITLIDQAFCRVKLADELRVLSQVQEAEKVYGEALESCDKLAKYPPQQVYPIFVVALKARAFACRGILRAEGGRLKQAESDLRQALDLVDRLQPHEQQLAIQLCLRDRAQVRSALGNVLWAQGSRTEAAYLFLAAEQEWRQAPGNPVRDNQLAWFLVTCPDPQFRNAKDAVELAQKAVKGIPEGEPWRVMGVVNYSPWECRRTLGAALYRAGDWNGTVEVLRKAWALARAGNGKAAGEAQAKELDLIRQGRIPGDDLSDLFFVAMADWQQGNKKLARAFYDEAVKWMKRTRPDDIELRRFREEAAQLLGIDEKKD